MISYTLKVQNCLELVTLASACASHLLFSPWVVIMLEHSEEVPVCSSTYPGYFVVVWNLLLDYRALRKPFESGYSVLNIGIKEVVNKGQWVSCNSFFKSL